MYKLRDNETTRAKKLFKMDWNWVHTEKKSCWFLITWENYPFLSFWKSIYLHLIDKYKKNSGNNTLCFYELQLALKKNHNEKIRSMLFTAVYQQKQVSWKLPRFKLSYSIYTTIYSFWILIPYSSCADKSSASGVKNKCFK